MGSKTEVARRIIRRKPGKVRKDSDMYFNSGTQAAIIEYQKLSDPKDLRARNIVYVERIHPAFEKLVENLINIHKFAGLYDSHDDLKSDCITFLFESLHKFDANRGTNAFSYFNIVAKHWLIIRSKQRVIRIKRNVSMDDGTALSQFDVETIAENAIIPSQDDIIAKTEKFKNVMRLLDEVRSRLKMKNEHVCMDAIMTLFNSIEDVDLLNKSAVLVYVRELSGLSPKQLTMTLYVIKKLYREVKAEDDYDPFGA